MLIKNRLLLILQELGIKMMVPTDELLRAKLGGMSLIRFNKLLKNESRTELSIAEAESIKTWLSELTGKAKEDIHLVEVTASNAQTA